MAGGLSNSKDIWIWDIKTGHLIQRLEGPGDQDHGVRSVALSSNGRELVSGGWDRTIKMWELSAAPIQPSAEGGRWIRTIEGHGVCYIFLEWEIMALLTGRYSKSHLASPLRLIADGSFRALGTMRLGGGIHVPAKFSSCSRAILIVSARSLPVPGGNTLLLDHGMEESVSGRIKECINEWRLFDAHG